MFNTNYVKSVCFSFCFWNHFSYFFFIISCKCRGTTSYYICMYKWNHNDKCALYEENPNERETRSKKKLYLYGIMHNINYSQDSHCHKTKQIIICFSLKDILLIFFFCFSLFLTRSSSVFFSACLFLSENRVRFSFVASFVCCTWIQALFSTTHAHFHSLQ